MADVETTNGEWSWERLRDSMTPAGRRNSDRRVAAMKVQFRMGHIFPWMQWPLLRLVYGFWGSILDEGIVSTCKPRWGALTFGYLNDGVSPSLWHTFQEVCGPRKYSMLYPAGAPRNKREADNYVEYHADWFLAKKTAEDASETLT